MIPHRFRKAAPAILLLGLFAIASCIKPYVEPVGPPAPEKTDGWAPIYDSSNTSKIIKAVAARPISKGGRIYVKDTILYQVEQGHGIHAISIAKKDAPFKLGFLEVVGAQEMAIIGNVLYTNNLNDLVAIDITDFGSPKLTDRISGAFHIFDANYPPGSGWYECIDSRKGKVVGWEIKSLNRPQCSR